MIEPGPLHWEWGVLATGPPGKSPDTPDIFFSDNAYKAPCVRHYTHTHAHTHTHTYAHIHIYILIAVVQSLSHAPVLETPWTGAHQAFLSFTISQSLLRLMSTESVMPSKYLILCHPLLLWPSIFPSIRVFSNKSALHITWPKYWSFSFSISPSSEY